MIRVKNGLVDVLLLFFVFRGADILSVEFPVFSESISFIIAESSSSITGGTNGVSADFLN